jgi:hypothetical protein
MTGSVAPDIHILQDFHTLIEKREQGDLDSGSWLSRRESGVLSKDARKSNLPQCPNNPISERDVESSGHWSLSRSCELVAPLPVFEVATQDIV